MTISNISAMPTAPTRTDPTNFSANADAWLAAFTNTTVPQLNTAINGINTAQAGADTDAATSTSAASNAQAAAATAQSTAKATAWVSGNTYQLNDCAISQVNFQTYRKSTTSSSSSGGATDPANDGTNWVRVTNTGTWPKSTRTTNTALVSGDNGKLIDITAAITQTFNAASGLGSGWYCIVRNSSSSYVTLDPNASEQIDGGLTLTMMPNEIRIVQCDGAAFTTFLINTEGYLWVREEQPSGTSGGNSLAGNNTRTLNTVKINTMNASLSGNAVTLQPGTYRCRVRAPAAYSIGNHKVSLFNNTDSTYTVVGTNANVSTSAGAGMSDSFATGQFTITAPKSFLVIHYIASASTPGLGAAVSSGQVEVYAEAEFWKIA